MAMSTRMAQGPWSAIPMAGLVAMLVAGLLGGARPVLAADGDAPLGADMSVWGPSSVGGDVGDIVRFDFVVANAGPETAAGVILAASADLFDLAVVAGLPDGATCAYAPLSCLLGDLAPGQSLALTIQGALDFPCGGMLTTSVTATTPDPVPGNNWATSDFGQGCTEYQPPEDPCLDEYGNWTCSECVSGSVDAGSDQVVTEGDVVTLTGVWETEAAAWSQPGGPAVVLSDAGSAAPTFLAPQVDADAVLTFALEGWSCAGPVEDTVGITVLDSPPIVICPSPQGVWKNADTWPLDTMLIGSRTFAIDELRAILGTPVRKDARLILAVQLIATRLSLASGAPNSATSEGLAAEVAEDASALLGQVGGSLFAKSSAVSTNSAVGRQMTTLAAALEAFAKGEVTEGCAG